MNYFELNGRIELLEPFTVNVPNNNHFPLNVHGDPIISASTLRGWLRFASYRCLVEVYKQHGLTFSIHEHYMLGKGVDTNDLIAKERATGIGSNVVVRNMNPLMDLYGRWGLAGALGVGNGIAPKSALFKTNTSSRSHISDQFDEFKEYILESEHEVLDKIMSEDGEFAPEIRILKQQIRNINNERRAATNIEAKDNLLEQLNDLDGQIAQLKNKKIGSKETIRRLNYGVDALDAGTSVKQTMKLSGNSDNSLKFLIWTISKLVLFPIGGMRSHNFGKVEPKWTITNHSFANPSGEAVGIVGWQDGKFINELNSGYMFDLEAFEESLIDENIFNFRVFG
jgi:hypothetical protein